MRNDSAVFIPSPTHQKDVVDDEKKEDNKQAKMGEEHKKPLGPVLTEDAPVHAGVTHSNSIGTESSASSNGRVVVVPLGFITNMAEYMVAADVLISKAGPGTISEAAALSLPVMLTSFLPGQEEGNVDYVVEGGFGAFCQDSDPQAVAEEVTMWLNNNQKLEEMSMAAKRCGAPNAARDIVKQIGDSTLKWRELNEGHNPLPEDYGEQEEREDLSEIYNEEEQIADFIAIQKPSEEVVPRSKDDSAI
jgi:glycosyltransferase involved in cell wall biosynthesis